MTISPTTTLDELAFIVGTALHRAGVVAVLSGGGAATYYAPEVNQSHDLDFILNFWSALGVSESCILDLGFSRHGDSYAHPYTAFTVEFPMGPLMVGSDPITEWDTIFRDDMVLNILSPTDCVRDRLAWFLLYQRIDYSALEQALAVARRHSIDLEKIKDWARREGAEARYELFMARYAALEP